MLKLHVKEQLRAHTRGGKDMPGRTGTCKDLAPEQQGREKLEKEALPLGSQRQHTEEEKGRASG